MSRKTVLVIEHDPATAEFLQLALTDEGYEVTSIDQCRNALRDCQKSHPALIVLDICPCDVDYETFFSECVHTTCIDTPLIILTTSLHPEDIQSNLHPQELLSKPFDLDVFLEQIHHHIDLASEI